MDLPLRLSQVRAKATTFEQSILDRLGALLDETDLGTLAEQLIPAGKESVHLHQEKALDMPANVLKETRRLNRLGLHQARRIIDLGAGSGTFCWVARQFGHAVMALEPPHHSQSINLPAFIRFYGVPLAEQLILPGVPLELSGRFDLVTSIAIMFNHSRGEDIRSYWTAADYLFFVEDLRANVLAPGGQVLLKFNVDLNGKSDPFLPRSVLEYYTALGRLLRPFIVKETADGIWLDPSLPPGPPIDLPLPPPEDSSTAQLTKGRNAKREWKMKERKNAQRGCETL